MKKPFIVSIQNNKIDTITQTSRGKMIEDFLARIAHYFALTCLSQEEIDGICEERSFTIPSTWPTLNPVERTICIVWIDVN